MDKKKSFLNLKIFVLFLFVISLLNFKIAFAEDKQWQVAAKSELQMPNKQWDIKFKSEIDETTVNISNIYILDTDKKKLSEVELKVIDSKTVRVIPKKEYSQGKTYFLCVDSGLKSKKGTNIKPYMMQFTVEKVDSDFFKVRNIEVISDNVFNVYFTQPINKDAELAVYYKLLLDGQAYVDGNYQTMDVKLMDNVNNGISINLKLNKLAEDKTYTLKVLGDLSSDYGTRIYGGLSVDKSFKGTCKKDEDLKLQAVTSLSNNVLQLSFNKSIDKASAEKNVNYVVTDIKGDFKIISSVLVDEYDKTKVKLKIQNQLKENEKYNLSITGIKDFYKNENYKLDDFNFVYAPPKQGNDFSIGAVTIDKRTLFIYFNQIPGYTDVINIANYCVYGVTDNTYYSVIPSKILYDPKANPRTAKLYFNKDFKSSETYKLLANRNIANNTLITYNNDFTCQFLGSNNELEELSITKAKIIGDSKIKLEFNHEIMSDGTNLSNNNYILECNQGESRKTTIGCSNVKYVDSKTLILTFNDMNFNEKYILKTNILFDYWGNNTSKFQSGINVLMGDI